MNGDRIAMPFHAGELQAQRLAGADPAAAPIRAWMPEQHRAFFPLLRFVCLAVPDDEGWPLATLVEGAPGFAHSPDPARLVVGALPQPGDPVLAHLRPGAAAGLLGIDLGTRRRNRLNGTVAQVSAEGFAVDVLQSFGNCPRYIQVRELAPVARQAGPVTAFTLDEALPARGGELLASSSTLFVASASGADAKGAAAGLDISHRGGPPGFARLEGKVLSIPDYNGNRYFNTLGNFIKEPRAAIVLADFASGDMLQLQGLVEIDWNAADPDRTPPVERVWRFRIVRGVLREGAFGLGSEVA